MRCRANYRLQEEAQLNFANEAKRRLMMIAVIAFGLMLLFSTVWNVKVVAIIFSVISLLFFILSDNMLCLVRHEAVLTKTKTLKGTPAYVFTVIKDLFFIACMVLVYSALHTELVV